MADPTAVLFDIDGTLVDSNFLHVEAWDYAFTSTGLNVPAWRIQQAIGADSNELLDQLIGDEPKSTRDDVKGLHDKRYKQLAPRLKILDGAQEIVAELAGRGIRVVLATSAPRQELDRLLTLLNIDDDTYAVTSAEDVKKAKPAPDIIAAALNKGGVDANHAVLVGDSVWDIKAATIAGVTSIGLLSGGTAEALLREAGAAEVYDDVATLLGSLDSSALARLLDPESVTS
ncbi:MULTISPECIES: HAD family hydrolase [unclassified Frondihabitans]|uniref:HAD family hydrolase n=1 Tax=unclassified Frondihabitans TaxID=2626248 RepID=UPI000F4E77DE|nr:MULTISPECIES: HAD family hydrolase [unclassified Frondihabitans]RPE77614.1 HAD superfamily hydrolase (TIGR01509 family)/HAD superfamily hydrolase (TIGR01549 family) [Frondihabitans sp. PhB153]RPF07891.1 HAD superfamily hydrolase (TIGR01509 family)/HAD superfamily hydrolase (TIGR01549 family) [Frondihabitans sp. PhB161]